MASFKTASDVRTVSDRSNRTSGADPDDVYDRRLSGRAYARDIRSCISNRQSGGDPGSLETVQKDEGMFPKPEKRWSAAEAAACILLVMTFGHLLNTVMNVTGFTRIFSGYQDMASKIYEGQNPLLLILSVGVLSAAAEEIVFRGMIYRRAKDFWGTGWGIAASCLLFGAYHGNVTQFVYAAVVSVLLILIYERCGTLLAPVLAHMAENIWGLYRSQFVSWMTQKHRQVHGCSSFWKR